MHRIHIHSGEGAASPFTVSADETVIVPVDTADSFVVGSDRMDRDPADTTKDTRAFFNKVKGAFRTGYTSGTQWDDANVGNYSHAEGRDTIASGSDSHAEGYLTKALGIGAHAEGVGARAVDRAHAEGSNSDAAGYASHAEGAATYAGGSYSHAEGEFSAAKSRATHAEGALTEALGIYSHAGGLSSFASRLAQYARASGQFAARGDAQLGHMVLRRQTADATAVVLTADAQLAAPASNIGETNVLNVPASRAFQLKVSTVARRTDVQGEMAGWTWEGLVGRDSTGNARIIGTPIQAAWGDAPATDAWALAVSIDTTDATNNYVAITATGEAAKTIRWVAKVEWVEVGG